MVQLAIPTFLGGPRDDLATADVYAQRTGAVINSIQKLANGGNLDFSSVLRGGEALLRELPIITGLSQGKLTLNKDNLVSRLMAASGSVVSGLRNMSSGMAGRIAGSIPQDGELYAKVGNVVQRVDVAQLSDLSSVGRTIGEVCNDPSLFSLQDQGAQVGVLSGLIQEATRYRIPNSFGSLMGNINNQYVLTRVAQQVLPAIIMGSDLPSLQSIADIMLPGASRMIYPNTIPEFGRRYRVAPGTPQQQRQQDYGTVIDTYTKIDPMWNRCKRTLEDGTEQDILSVHNLQGASSDMQQMITVGAQKATVADDQLLALANVFQPTNVDDELKKHFPLTVTGAQMRQTSNVVDPRSLLA